MVESGWRIADPWADVLRAGRFGTHADEPGLMVTPLHGLTMIGVTAGRGAGPSARKRLAEVAAVDLPKGPGIARGSDVDALWATAESWTLIADQSFGLAGKLEQADLGADPVDQSHARGIVRLEGPQVREILARGCLVDLHPRSFKPGDAAATAISLIGVQLWQLDERPRFEISVARTFAANFWEWLESAALREGIEVREPDRRSPP